MVFLVLLAGFCLAAAAKPDLGDIMKANGKAFSAIEKGIAKQKFEGLGEKAQLLADQATLVAKEYEPPVNKEEIEKFRALAVQLNQQALALKDTLGKADSTESKKQLKKLEQTCISCHKAFIPKRKKP